MVSLAPLNLLKNSLVVLKCFSQMSMKIITSSMYALQFSRSVVTLLIWRWKVAGEFLIPKSMTLYLYSPSGVAKAEISLARSVKGTCQNPFRRSNSVTYLAFPALLIQSSILTIGEVSVLVTLFTFLQSAHIQ